MEPLNLPFVAPNGIAPVRQVHFYSSFIQRWLSKGALADFYSTGTKLNVHTISWTDFLKNGNFLVKVDDATWSVDGKAIGKGDAMLRQIEKWGKDGDVIVQYLTPLGWLPPGDTVVSDIDDLLVKLKAGNRIQWFRVQPLQGASRKYLNEELLPSLPK